MNLQDSLNITLEKRSDEQLKAELQEIADQHETVEDFENNLDNYLISFDDLKEIKRMIESKSK